MREHVVLDRGRRPRAAPPSRAARPRRSPASPRMVAVACSEVARAAGRRASASVAASGKPREPLRCPTPGGAVGTAGSPRNVPSSGHARPGSRRGARAHGGAAAGLSPPPMCMRHESRPRAQHVGAGGQDGVRPCPRASPRTRAVFFRAKVPPKPQHWSARGQLHELEPAHRRAAAAAACRRPAASAASGRSGGRSPSAGSARRRRSRRGRRRGTRRARTSSARQRPAAARPARSSAGPLGQARRAGARTEPTHEPRGATTTSYALEGIDGPPDQRQRQVG